MKAIRDLIRASHILNIISLICWTIYRCWRLTGFVSSTTWLDDSTFTDAFSRNPNLLKCESTHKMNDQNPVKIFRSFRWFQRKDFHRKNQPNSSVSSWCHRQTFKQTNRTNYTHLETESKAPIWQSARASQEVRMHLRMRHVGEEDNVIFNWSRTSVRSGW